MFHPRQICRASKRTALLLALTTGINGVADTTETIVPESTKVLVLCPFDSTNEIHTSQTARTRLVRTAVQRQLISRNFIVLGEAYTTGSSFGPDTKDLGDAMDALAVGAGADWVTQISVRELKLEIDRQNEGRFVSCTVLLQIRDARKKLWLADRVYTGRIFFHGPIPDLFEEVLSVATAEALFSVLWPYPVVIPVLKNDLIEDYTSGAKVPVFGTPGRLFERWTLTEKQ